MQIGGYETAPHPRQIFKKLVNKNAIKLKIWGPPGNISWKPGPPLPLFQGILAKTWATPLDVQPVCNYVFIHFKSCFHFMSPYLQKIMLVGTVFFLLVLEEVWVTVKEYLPYRQRGNKKIINSFLWQRQRLSSCNGREIKHFFNKGDKLKWDYSRPWGLNLSQRGLDRDSRSRHCQKVSLDKSWKSRQSWFILTVSMKISTQLNLDWKVWIFKISTKKKKLSCLDPQA
jgi:hypothetical protein